MTYRQSIAVVLDGVSGCNHTVVARGAGVSAYSVRTFLGRSSAARHGEQVSDKIVEQIAWFVWRRLNRHVLLSEEDYSP